MQLLRSRKKAPKKAEPATADSSPQLELDRPTADEIFEQVSRNARHELIRPAVALAISGLAGGITMGLSALSISLVVGELGHSRAAHFVADLFYPLGFIAVIVGRA